MNSKPRKRRRELCTDCGKSFSQSWFREHRLACRQKKLKADSSPSTAEIPPVVEGASYMYEAGTCNIDCHSKNLDIEKPPSPARMQEAVCPHPQLPNNISDQFVKLLDDKIFEKEDIQFFEGEVSEEQDDDNSSEMLADSELPHQNLSTGAPATEVWDDPEDDEEVDGDFEVNRPEDGDAGDMKATNSKLETLVLWLMLFLCSWQSNYCITDGALVVLIKFLCRFFWLLGAFDNTMATLARLFPSSHYRLKKALGMLGDDFTKFVVCPKCKSLYKYEDCLEVRSGQQVSARCKFVAWPHHPHRTRRGPCGEFLLKSVRTGKRTILYPRMVFPYNSVIKSLQTLLNRPDFWNSCQKWRGNPAAEGIMADIHHGDLWKELAKDGFLANKNGLALILNVDWFKPHKHSPGSVGVIYMVVLNLPREERYKIENVIVVGVLPGPGEPKLTANSFLEPLVEELQTLWKANERFSVSGSLFRKRIQVGLVCVACDIPAARKIGGFMGHMANQGCSRCRKEFYKDGKLDFSGFDRQQWLPRSSADHKWDGKETLSATTPTARQNMCSHHGARYSVLHDLEYFDCIRFFVVDPMHNLYLGTAKNMMKHIWLNEDSPLFDAADFEKMQVIVDSMVTPQDIGRIPGKIANSFGGFTADQWQSWTVVYSLCALQGILSDNHLACWTSFVAACKLLGKKTITLKDIEEGDLHLISFLNQFEDLYGSSSVTPNMHLHGHLKECLLDFGPFHGFWCFSFERYNGILGSYPTNNRAIEIQIMRKFLAQIKSKVFEFPDMYKEDFVDFFSEQNNKGSLKTTIDPIESHLALHRTKTLDIFSLDSVDWTDVFYVQAMPPIKDYTMDRDDIRYLETVYSKLLNVTDSQLLDIPLTVAKFDCVKNGNVLFGSLSSRTIRNSYALASWAGTAGRIAETADEAQLRPCEVVYYFRHRVRVKSQDLVTPAATYLFYMARVNWYCKHPDRDALGNHVQVWCDDFDCFGPACFLPIQRISSQFAGVRWDFRQEKVMLVTTLPGD